MIDKTQLRIGNLIYAYSLNDKKESDLRVATVNGVGYGWLEYNYEGKFNHCSSKPIQLTEEWLIRFGFEKLIPNGSVYKLGDFHIQDFSPLGFYECANHIKIEYVHQLQNLYFALTGEELKLTENDTH